MSNGPQIVFSVDGKEVGQIVGSENKKVNWSLQVYSPVAYETVEIFVNGDLVWTKKNKKGKGIQSFSGSVKVPSGGWITARVSGGQSEWPMMDSYPFAESSPIWFGETGSMRVEEWSTVFTPTDIDGKPLPPEGLPLVQTLTNKKPAHGSFYIKNLKGESHFITVTSFPLEGRPNRFLGAMALFWNSNFS